MKKFSRSAPRSFILLIDLIIIFFSVMISFLLRFNFNIPENDVLLIPYALLVFMIIRGVGFLITKSFSGIIRYTETQDITRILIMNTIGSVVIVIADIIIKLIYDVYVIPRSVIIIEFIASSVGMIAFRLVVKSTYWELKTPNSKAKNVIIFGAGEAALITNKALNQNSGENFKVIAFIDDQKNKVGKKIENIPIYHSSKLEQLIDENEIEQLIISIQNISPKRKKEIAELCLAKNVKVQNVPPVKKWINGELSFRQIQDINILELLDRDEINLDKVKIKKQLTNKVILVTGAAGSIGSEIARQVIEYFPKKVILLDVAETPIYHLELEFTKHPFLKNIDFVVADIRNQDRMEKVFSTFKPDIIFHAAAYKHVPLMEKNPSEAILTNIHGTKTLADLSIKFDVEKFIMISTDKAVNPTNVMGASKRIAEIYVQTLNSEGKTKFITTRFGNVLGSNGSVIPLFTKQIQSGGPLTLTHPEITRYFMTIPEACQLVLEAGAKGNGGEIFVFDMGKSVKILDLAKKMIKLSGKQLGTDIQIVFTGLRPGEKLYEEVLATNENTLPTDNSKILIAKVREYELSYVQEQINNLIHLFESQDNFEIVKQMKKIVPEFVSKNSIYEELDKD
ncbi:MAG: polysaccharide biosynthesis protein [Bacteroidetes bacterium]|nr:MAG: polysaccharide biosynthesis protein [Bacteroidota bacterium]